MTYKIKRYRDYREIFGKMKDDVTVKTFKDRQKCIDWINSLKLADYQWDGWANKATPENLLWVCFDAEPDEEKVWSLEGPYDHDYGMTFHVTVS